MMMTKNKDFMMALMIAMLVAFNLIDAIVTVIFVRWFGAVELNPFMKAVLTYSPEAFVVVKLGYTAFAADIAWQHRSMKSVFAATFGVTFAYALNLCYQAVVIVSTARGLK